MASEGKTVARGYKLRRDTTESSPNGRAPVKTTVAKGDRFHENNRVLAQRASAR